MLRGKKVTDALLDLPTERLSKAKATPLLRRTMALAISYFVVFLSATIGWISRLRSQSLIKRNRTMSSGVFVGKFESQNWLNAHIKPIVDAGLISNIVIVSDETIAGVDYAEFSTPPKVVRILFGTVFGRVLWAYWIARKRSASVVGGFHLLCNGMAAIAIGQTVGARSIYFCVGGWAEIEGGGVYSGTRFFSETGVHSQWLERQLLKIVARADLVVTMGSNAKDYLNRKRITNVMRCPGGIDTDRFSVLDHCDQDIDLILIARLDPIKRIDRFIEICAIIRSEFPNLKAVIVGTGPDKEKLETIIEDGRLGNTVMLVGFQSDVSQWLRRSKILLVTSDSEGLPLSVMEAVVMGLPVVGAKIGDMADVISDSYNGFLIEKDDVDEYARKVISLLVDEKKRGIFSKNSAVRGKDLTVEAAARKWMDVFGD